MSGSRLPVVDGLRGIAILAVIYHHAFARFTPPGFQSFHLDGHLVLPFALLSNGWLGVNLFFVLSGLVLFLPYASGVRGIATASDAGAFYRHRARRLLPLYYFCSLLCFALLLPASQKDWGTLLALLGVTFNFSKDTFIPAYNWVLWSLGVEIWFSILFPLLVIVEKRTGILALLGGVACLSLATRVYGNQPEFYPATSPVLNFVKDGVAGRIDDFVVGMAIARAYGRLRSRPPDASRLLLAFGAGVAAIYLAAVCWDAVRLQRLDHAIVPLTNCIFQFGCFLSVTALLLMRGRLPRLFANPALQVLGTMCYSLYVWHGVILLRTMGAPPSAASLGACLAIVLVVSALSYRYIEFGHVRDGRSLFRAARPGA